MQGWREPLNTLLGVEFGRRVNPRRRAWYSPRRSEAEEAGRLPRSAGGSIECGLNRSRSTCSMAVARLAGAPAERDVGVVADRLVDPISGDR